MESSTVCVARLIGRNQTNKKGPQITQISADLDSRCRCWSDETFPSLRYYPSKSLQDTKIFITKTRKGENAKICLIWTAFFVFSSFRAFVTKSFAVDEGLGGLPGRKPALWIVLSSFAGKWPRCVICGSLIC